MHISPQLGALEIHMDGMGYTIGYDVAADLKIVHMSTLCTAQGPSQSIDQSKSPNIIIPKTLDLFLCVSRNIAKINDMGWEVVDTNSIQNYYTESCFINL